MQKQTKYIKSQRQLTFDLKGSIENRKVPIAYKFKEKKRKVSFSKNINRDSSDSIFIKDRFTRLKNSLCEKNDLIEEFLDISIKNELKS